MGDILKLSYWGFSVNFRNAPLGYWRYSNIFFTCDRAGNLALFVWNKILISPPGGAILVAKSATYMAPPEGEIIFCFIEASLRVLVYHMQKNFQ